MILRVWWHIAGRFFEVQSARALTRSARALARSAYLSEKSMKFFSRIGGTQ